MEKVLVTGGAGFIGSHLVDRLVERGNAVVVVDNLSSGSLSNLKKSIKKIKIYRYDVRSKKINDIFSKEKIDIVFHLAAIPDVNLSVKNPIITHDVNVNGLVNILDLCRKYDVSRIIFSSSSSIYGEQKNFPINENCSKKPLSPYALHKLIGEEYLDLFFNLYDLQYISLRYFNVYGPRQLSGVIPKFCRLLFNRERPIINGDGNQTRDFIYVSDVIDANIRALETNSKLCFGKSFNIGTGKETTINDLLHKISKLVGINIKPSYRKRLNEPIRSIADIEMSIRYLKWKPNINIDEGLRKYTRWFRSTFL